MINETNTVYEVIEQYWIDLHNLCMEDNPTRKSLTIGQKYCNGAYYQARNGIEFALNSINLLVEGNPNLEPMKNGEPHINSYSMAELQSMYQTTNLDFYETALIFRRTRISELHEEINLNYVIQDRIEKFAQNIGWTLSYDKKKSSVKSKKAVQEVITYTQSQVDAVNKDLAAKGLLSLKK